jgi:hypothetical protein
MDHNWQDYIGISSHLTEPLQEMVLAEALRVTRAIDERPEQVKALANLASYLPQPLREQLLKEALEIVRAIEQESEQVKALSKLVSCLPPSFLQDALVVARSIKDADYQAISLAWLLPYLPEKPLQYALSTARTIRQDSERAKALSHLASQLPKTLQGQVVEEAITTWKAIKEPLARIEAMIELLPFLPESLRERVCKESLVALPAIGGLTRDCLLGRLAPYLPESLLLEALAAARMIKWGSMVRRLVLPSLARRLITLSHSTLTSLWLARQGEDNLLHFSAHRSRPEFLSDLRDLTPVIVTLGGKEAIVEIFRAIQDVGRWWP